MKRKPTKKDLQKLAQKRLTLLEQGLDPKDAKESEAVAEVLKGLGQLVSGQGFASDRPLTELGILGFYQVIQLLGLEVVKQSASGSGRLLLDHMKVKYGRVKFNLYNLVDPDQTAQVWGV